MKWQYTKTYVEALSRYHDTKTRPKPKGFISKNDALHLRHDFWYISETFSAKHDIK